jgi:hypothetical protein
MLSVEEVGKQRFILFYSTRGKFQTAMKNTFSSLLNNKHIAYYTLILHISLHQLRLSDNLPIFIKNGNIPKMFEFSYDPSLFHPSAETLLRATFPLRTLHKFTWETRATH